MVEQKTLPDHDLGGPVGVLLASLQRTDAGPYGLAVRPYGRRSVRQVPAVQIRRVHRRTHFGPVHADLTSGETVDLPAVRAEDLAAVRIALGHDPSAPGLAPGD